MFHISYHIYETMLLFYNLIVLYSLYKMYSNGYTLKVCLFGSMQQVLLDKNLFYFI